MRKRALEVLRIMRLTECLRESSSERESGAALGEHRPHCHHRLKRLGIFVNFRIFSIFPSKYSLRHILLKLISRAVGEGIWYRQFINRQRQFAPPINKLANGKELIKRWTLWRWMRGRRCVGGNRIESERLRADEIEKIEKLTDFALLTSRFD